MMTHLIQVQGKNQPNQCRHLINHPNFPVKCKSDNEETPLEKPHQDTFTSKHEILERIKRLHINCGFLYTEHLLMLLLNLLNQRKVLDVNARILQNFYNAYCTLKYFF